MKRVIFGGLIIDSYKKVNQVRVPAKVDDTAFGSTGAMFDAIEAKSQQIRVAYAGLTQGYIKEWGWSYTSENDDTHPAASLNVSNANKAVVTVQLLPNPDTGEAKFGRFEFLAAENGLFLPADNITVNTPLNGATEPARDAFYDWLMLFVEPASATDIACEVSDGEYIDASQGTSGFLHGKRVNRGAKYGN